MPADLSTYDGAMQAVGAGQEATGRQPLHEWSPEEMVAKQNKWFQRVTDDRRHIERWALLSTAFLLDQQYVDFVGVGNDASLRQMPAKRGRVRTIEQIIEPAYRTEMSRLLRNRPQGTTVPDGIDEDDIESAQAADDILAHVWPTREVDEVFEQAVSWQIVGGTSLIATSWDPALIDADGQPGDFVFRALSPFEFGVPNLREPALKKQPYVMVTKAYDLDEIEDIWGVRVTADNAGSYGSLDHRLASVISGGTRSGSDEHNQAVVKETWVKPGPMAPKGAVLVTAGDQVLDLQVWPEWCENQYPFEKLVYTHVPGAFWGKSMLQALIPIQRRHNRAASIVVEVQNMLAQMAVAVPRNSQVRSLLGGKGLMVETPPGSSQPVTNLTAPPVGDFPFRELENTAAAARNIASQHEVTKGFTPPNVRSGTAISMLKEMDDSPAAMPLRYIERAAQGVGRKILALVKAKWDEPRIIRVIGRDGEIERRSFLAGKDAGGQYMVLEGSAWPYTKAERQAEILQLVTTPTADGMPLISSDEALKRLDMGAIRGIREEREIDYREARLENQKFEELKVTIKPDGQIGFDGEVPAPEDFQNHMVHVEAHLRLMKSPQWRQWSPLKKMALEAHVVGHKAALYGQMAMQRQEAISSGQAPPAAPAPSIVAEAQEADAQQEAEATEEPSE